MDFDAVTQCLRSVKGAGVGCAAEGAFETKGCLSFQATIDFVKEEFARFDGYRLNVEWRQATGEFICVEESRNGIEQAKVGAGESGFTCAIAAREEIENRGCSGILHSVRISRRQWL